MILGNVGTKSASLSLSLTKKTDDLCIVRELSNKNINQI
jgi:hypothetical protein